MKYLAACFIVSSMLGIILNNLLNSPCKEGYVRISMPLTPSVCVYGYANK